MDVRNNVAQPALREELVASAKRLGFYSIGFASAREPIDPEGRLRHFVEQGRHGSMHWLQDSREVRENPRHAGMLPSAETVIMLTVPFLGPDESGTDNATPHIARYAQRFDYHRLLSKKIQRLCNILRRAGFRTRGGMDLLPILERAWAERAGLGFVGKNCMLIVPGLGSHLVLAAIVTEAVFEPDSPMKERCGTCDLCLRACPTQAFIGPRELDARRCISYLTIEADTVPTEALAGYLFGCDACQDVCPFNKTTSRAPMAGLEKRKLPVLSEFANMSQTWQDAIQGTPLTRRRPEELHERALALIPEK